MTPSPDSTAPGAEAHKVIRDLLDALATLGTFYRHREPWLTCGVNASIKEAEAFLATRQESGEDIRAILSDLREIKHHMRDDFFIEGGRRASHALVASIERLKAMSAMSRKEGGK